MSRRRRQRAMLAAGILTLLLCSAGCNSRADAWEDAAIETGGSPDRGMSAIGRYGCGSCHEIPGIGSARGTVGPPLSRIAMRTYLAGRLTNSPTNMRQWIQHPQQVEPGTAMPDLGVTERDARDITAYLWTLR